MNTPVRIALLAAPTLAYFCLLGISRAPGYPGDVFHTGAPVAQPAVAAGGATGSAPYSVAARTGAAQYAFPIVVPPGRRGMQPVLALEYSSQSPLRGGLAAGWTLHIPAIRVDVSRGRLGGVGYVSTLAGGQPLVRVSEPNTPAGTEAYRAQQDPTFTRYQRVLPTGPGDPGSWRALMTDGTTYYFGNDSDARDRPSDPDDTGGAARWFVTRVVDRLGNAIVYDYRKVGWHARNGNVQSVPVDIALERIDYTLNDNPAGPLGAHASVTFDYAPVQACETQGSYVPIGAQFDYRTGIRIYEGALRLDKIHTWVRESAGAAPVERREITLGYNDAAADCTGEHAPLRLLETISERARSRELAWTAAPTIHFDYGDLTRSFTGDLTIEPLEEAESAGHGQGPLDEHKGGGWPTVQEMWMDLDGDGRTDVLRSLELDAGRTCGFEWRRNEGGGRFADWQSSPLPTHPWADGVTRNRGFDDQGLPEQSWMETCSLSHQFTRRRTPVPEPYECRGRAANYISYRFMDFDGDADPDLVTALDHKQGTYWPTDDAMLMTSHYGDYPVCADLGEKPCVLEDFHFSCRLSNVGEAGPVPAAAPSAPSFDDKLACTHQCESDYDGDCPVATCEVTAGEGGGEPTYECLSCSSGTFAWTDPPDRPDWLGLGREGDPGAQGEDTAMGNENCAQVPEGECGWFPWRVHPNRPQAPGGVILPGQPRPVFDDDATMVASPVPLESDRPVSGSGGQASSAWHGFLDMDGDGCTDAIWQMPLTSFDSAAWEDDGGDFLVFRGDCQGGYANEAHRWRAPTVVERARVSLHHVHSTCADPAHLNTTCATIENRQHLATDSVVELADINGDALADYVDGHHHDGSPARVFYNTGDGFERSATVLSNRLPTVSRRIEVPLEYEPGGTTGRRQVRDGYSVDTLRLIDLDQDGLVDVSEVPVPPSNEDNPWQGPETTLVHFNSGDRLIESRYAFNDLRHGLGRVQISRDHAWSVKTDMADFDGDGVLDLYANDDAVGSCNLADDLDRIACGRSGNIRVDEDAAEGLRLLRSVDNGKGLTVRFDYAPGSDETVVSTVAGHRSPGSLWVVAAMTVAIAANPPLGGSESVTTYHYTNPVSNRAPPDVSEPARPGRFGFRGFETVSITGATATAADGTLTRPVTVESYRYDVDFSGRLIRRVVKDGLGHPFRIDSTTWRRLVLFHQTDPDPAKEQDLVWAFMPAETTARTCGATMDETACQASGALKRVVQGYAPRFVSGAATHASTWLSPADPLCIAPGTVPMTSIAVLYEHCAERVTDATGSVVIGDRGRQFSYRLDQSLGTSSTAGVHQLLLTEERAIQAEGPGGAGWGITSQQGRTVVTPDGNGLPTTTVVYLDASGGTATTLRGFDRYGNLTTVRRAAMVAASRLLYTVYAYDPAFQVNVRTTTDELGRYSTSLIDYATGLPYDTAALPQVGGTPRELVTYDGFGRVLTRSRITEIGTTYSATAKQIEAYSYFDGAPLSTITQDRWIDYAGTQKIHSVRSFDGLGRLLSEQRSVDVGATTGTAVTTWSYDAAGNIAIVTAPNPQGDAYGTVAWSFDHDALGRVTLTRPPDGAALRVQHDGADGLTEFRIEVDPVTLGAPADGSERRPVTLVNDAFGRLRRVIETGPGGTPAVTTYSYDANDNLARIVDADSIVTDLEQNWVGWRTRISREGRTWRYAYDPNGNRLREIAPYPSGALESNYTTSYVYDEADRIVSALAPVRNLTSAQLKRYGQSSSRLTTYTYASPTATGSTLNANARGRLNQVKLSSGTTLDYSYNAEGQVKQAKLGLSIDPLGTNKPIKDTRTFKQDLNALGLPTRVTYPDGATVATTHYDRSGNPADVVMTRGDTSDLLAKLVRNTAGVPTARSSVFPQSQSWTYDKLGRLYDGRVLAGATTIAGEQLTYDQTGHVIQSYDYGTNIAIGYDYDAQDQLVYAGSSDNQRYIGYWSYSPGGRPLSSQVISNVTGTEVFPRDVDYDYGTADGKPADYASVKRLRSPGGTSDVELDYDLSGNLTKRIAAGKIWDFVSDGDDQLRQATVDGASEVFYYDHAGQRLAAYRDAWNGAPARLRVWFGGCEFWYTPTTSGGTLSKRLTYVAMGAQPVARITDGNLAGPELLYNGVLGHLLAVLDKTSSVRARYSYGPFGEQLTATGPSAPVHDQRFNGKVSDELSGLIYYGYRYYDRMSAMWTSADPLYRFAPDLAWSEPRRTNSYALDLNNPMSFMDEDGLDPARFDPIGGHHRVPHEITNGLLQHAGLSRDAAEVFRSSTTGWAKGVASHGWSVAHKLYNGAVAYEFARWRRAQGITDLAKMTGDQASAFVQSLARSRNPLVRQFLKAHEKVVGQVLAGGEVSAIDAEWRLARSRFTRSGGFGKTIRGLAGSVFSFFPDIIGGIADLKDAERLESEGWVLVPDARRPLDFNLRWQQSGCKGKQPPGTQLCM